MEGNYAVETRWSKWSQGDLKKSCCGTVTGPQQLSVTVSAHVTLGGDLFLGRPAEASVARLHTKRTMMLVIYI